MAIDILNAFSEEPQELDFVLPNFLAGTVGGFIAPGSSGKSYMALQQCMGIACSVAGGDLLGLNPPKTGSVVYINAEDPEVIVKRRLHAIGGHLEMDAKRSIANNLKIEPMVGKMLNITNDAQRERIIEYCAGARLIVFDTLSRIHDLDENNNSHGAIIISLLENIAVETGAAVMFLHHVSKASAFGGMADLQQAARGASTLIDNARWCGYVAKMTKDEGKGYTDRHFDKRAIDEAYVKNYVRFGVAKNNYGELFSEKWFKFNEGGVLKPVDLLKIQKDGKDGQSEHKRSGGKLTSRDVFG